MTIETAQEYNDKEMRRYQERVEEWKADKFTNNIIPQIAFFGFRKRNGELKDYGYVASDKRSAYWAEHKWQALARYHIKK
jgi:hypothetical protein